jgi:hypothetical protein
MTTLDLCACKRGFFTLRDCGNPASTSCELCTRRFCDEHMAPRVGARVCVECAAKQDEGEQPQPAAAAGQTPAQQQAQAQAAVGQPAVGEEDMLDREYPYRYRRRYYDSWGYYPWWWASYDPYYNDWGYRAFDDDDDDDGGGFGDS